MARCIGTKIVNMAPMTRGEYNAFRGWTVPADENASDEGYLVEYLDGGAPNTPHYAGYVSWSPKAQADAAYRAADGLTFGLAIEALKKGARVARAGWNGKNMWLVMAGSGGNWSAAVGGGAMPDDWRGNLPFIAMFTADKHLVPWLASQTDMLADDWRVVE
ncbi:DUF2829 domain-containing protein [Burkholderia stagnalis]|nr:DUF2829 domain-containing protein [Burkholderia stagnalis]RQY67264.1 DUF2829 domain-containing protein [Burkholderia stagnalis]RQY80029.1 DUF2829 domain-containing protein [Burkholderia stagnalis]